MSTRAQVIIKDSYGEVWFYRHSDGYPEGIKESLSTFMEWVKSGKIRDNVSQSSGWLVIIGHQEYNTPAAPDMVNDNVGMSWKVGAYEPCAPVEHGDIEYLYTIDLEKKQVTYCDIETDYSDMENLVLHHGKQQILLNPN